MEYYAHTAEGKDGRQLPECHWQLLREHLRNVAHLAKQFAEPLGLAAEAELAGLLHDLGNTLMEKNKPTEFLTGRLPFRRGRAIMLIFQSAPLLRAWQRLSNEREIASFAVFIQVLNKQTPLK